MNILILTQLYPQPDDVGDNKPTRTVEYFAKEWVALGHKVIVAHCPSKLEKIVHGIDPACFMVVTRVSEVKGRGFSLDKNAL